MNIYNVRQMLRTKSIYDLDLRVVYYARVSTEKVEQKNSIVNQRCHFEDLIKSNPKWTFCGGYIDDGISGIHAEKREEFQRMISDARAGKFDLIITKEISRFARNTLDSIQYTRQLLSYGICVWFQNDNINTIDDDSEFRLTIMAGVAQDEIRKLSNRVKFGHEQAIKRGVVMGNSRIYGFDKENGRLVINEKEAEMIRIIFEKYATGEWTTPKIEKLLYDQGYRNHNGGRINRNVINHIICNPKYKGWYAGGKVKIVDMFTKKQEFIPENEWHMFKDDGSKVPAIVSEEVWDLANKYWNMRSDAIKNRRTSFKNGNLFTGKIFCENDNAPYWLKQHSVRGTEDVKWTCSYKIKNGAKNCSSFPLSEKELCCMTANLINESVKNIDLIFKQYLEIFEKNALGNNDYSSKILALNQKISVLKQKQDKILDYNLSGSISDEEFLKRNKDFSEKITQIELEIEELKKQKMSSGDAEKRLARIAEKIKEFSGIKESDINRKVVEILIDKITVNPIGERTAKIKFFLNGLGERELCYASTKNGALKTNFSTVEKTSCSEHIFLKMFPEQHTVFYRDLRSFSGHKMPIEYYYSLAI